MEAVSAAALTLFFLFLVFLGWKEGVVAPFIVLGLLLATFTCLVGLVCFYRWMGLA